MNILKRLFRVPSCPPVVDPWPSHEVLYILRPKDGVRRGRLPKRDPAHGEVAYRVHREEGVEDLYVAVCDFCGENCGQCGTSIGMGVPFSFDRIVIKSGM